MKRTEILGKKFNPYTIWGEENELIGYRGPKPIKKANIEGYYRIRSKDEANNEYKQENNIEILDQNQPILAYYLLSADEVHSYLVPVYAYYDRQGLLQKTIFATDFPLQLSQRDVVSRSKATLNQMVSSDPDQGTLVKLGIMPKSSYQASAYYTASRDDRFKNDCKGFLGSLNDTCSEDICWAGMNLSEMNRTKFVEDRDNEIELADIAFIASDGDPYGWYGGSEVYLDISKQDVEYGDSDLEWIVSDSCEVLADHRIPEANKSSQQSVFKWDKIFHGLHLLLGYGTMIINEEHTGEIFAKNMISKETIIYSWFKTAKNIRHTDGKTYFWAGVLFPYNETINPGPENDHLWGYGYVSPDIMDPDGFIAIYSPC